MKSVILPIAGILAVVLVPGCAAYQNTVTSDGPGRYQIKSVEAPDVWATNTTALDYHINNEADKVCPHGWKRGELTKAKEAGEVIYYTTISCTENVK